jgi:hypothetical protein
MQSGSSQPSAYEAQVRNFDASAILKSVWLPFVSWLVAVLIVAFGGRQPGVVCVTPMAWLLALWVGLRCALYTRTEKKAGRLLEAALSGGLLGLLQGVLFAAIAPLMGEIKSNEQQKAVLLTVIMLLVGTAVASLLSLAICASQESRRRTG